MQVLCKLHEIKLGEGGGGAHTQAPTQNAENSLVTLRKIPYVLDFYYQLLAAW